AFQFETWQGKQKTFVRTGWNLAPSQDSQFQQSTDFLNAAGLHRLWSHRELQLPERIELSAGEQSSLKFPSTQFGLIQKESQTSIHSIEVKKNDLLRFRVLARAYGSMLDPVLFVSNADGKLQVQKDDIAKDNLDVDLTWKVPADGKYSVEVKDRYGHFGPRYFYLLHAEPEHPRFELMVEKENYVTSADKPLEIAVTVKRIAGYKGEITIRADSLPEGCVCESVNSAEKGDSAKKVTLKVDTKNAKPFNGPIQINGEGNDEKKRKQIATVTLKVKDRVSQSIWLTVPVPAAKK
ncbi:MAG: hypothetical protein JKY95_14575, partial [Planctomycetaceae bacterium]|nr:hypothetical protein [Planctomycetaceae bacterium]